MGDFSIPWLVDVSPQCLPSRSRGVFPVHTSVSVPKVSLFVWTQSDGSRAHPNGFIFAWSSAKPLFPNKVMFTGPGSHGVHILQDAIQPVTFSKPVFYR